MAASGEVNPTESQGADQMVSQQQGSPGAEDNDSDSQKLVEGMMTVSQAMQAFGENLSGVVPPEGLKALQAAISAYHQFLTIAQKAMGVSGMEEEEAGQPAQGPQGPQSAMTSGAKGPVVSADMPQRKGMQPA